MNRKIITITKRLGFGIRPLRLLVYAMICLPVSALLPTAQAATNFMPYKIPVCYHFGCNSLTDVRISPEEWRQVTGWFTPTAKNAEEERTQIKHAVGWLEVILGRYTPIYLDLGQDLMTQGRLGQMDCIDEEKNVTTFLHVFEYSGLLKFHKVVEPAYRRTAWDQHWAGQIEELDSQERWVIDSWFQAYGNNPYVQTAEQWGDIPFIFSSANIDNSPD